MTLQAHNWSATGMKAYDRNHFGVQQYYRADDADRRIEALESAMREFVARCEAGEILSKRTYAQFKGLLGG